MRSAQLEIVEVDTFPAHGNLDHAMQFAERKTGWHQNAPPHHGADPGQPDFDLEDRGGVRRGQQGAFVRNRGLWPSLHPTKLAPAAPLVLGTPQKVMLSRACRERRTKRRRTGLPPAPAAPASPTR